MTGQLKIESIQVGKVAPLGPDGVPSGFVKKPVAGEVMVGALGLAGDGVADLSVHGGVDKAVYAYPLSHYSAWGSEFPEHSDIWGAGAVGENLTVCGADERDVRIGDVFAAPSGLTVQVTQPRQPCFKFALRFGDDRMPQAMVRNGRCGWYLRVLSEGALQAGEELKCTERGPAAWTVARFQHLTTLGKRELTRGLLAEMADLEPLAKVWRDWARARSAR